MWNLCRRLVLPQLRLHAAKGLSVTTVTTSTSTTSILAAAMTNYSSSFLSTSSHGDQRKMNGSKVCFFQLHP
jgi:hypothetical protein